MLKRLLTSLLILGSIATVSQAAPTVYIQSRATLQSGTTIYTSSGTVQTFNASTATVTLATISSSTISNFTVTQATVTTSLAMNAKKILNLASGTAATDAAAFSQIKVIQSTFSAVINSSSTSVTTFIPTNLKVVITPTSASNSIFVIAGFSLHNANPGTNLSYATISGTTSGNLGNGTNGLTVLGADAAMSGIYTPTMIMALDSPATTNQQTYTVQIRSLTSVATGIGTQSERTWIAAFEIVTP